MHPFYFGRSERPLFGLYHPSSNPSSVQGAVIAYPMGHEYLPAYPALKQLAIRLARAGVHVLRFDYSGSGDSAGETGEASLPDWVDDLERAIAELKAMAAVKQVTLIGLRLGASLAVIAGRKSAIADRFVIWEPVVEGKAYLQELRELAESYAANTLPRPREAVLRGPPFEVLGFPINPGLERSLAEVDLLRGPALDGPSLVLSRDPTRAATLAATLGPVTLQTYDEANIWRKNASMDDAVVPARTLDGIVAWVGKP
jgi:uncharacterized protein